MNPLREIDRLKQARRAELEQQQSDRRQVIERIEEMQRRQALADIRTVLELEGIPWLKEFITGEPDFWEVIDSTSFVDVVFLVPGHRRIHRRLRRSPGGCGWEPFSHPDVCPWVGFRNERDGVGCHLLADALLVSEITTEGQQ
jgi:hypothetical protein